MTMPGGYYDRVCGESRLANGWIVASSFTARSLAEGGIPLDKISVVPYGVDADRFDGVEPWPARGRTFRVIFVGSMVQRKGLADLLEAIRLLKTSQIQVVLCGRGVIDAELIKKYGDRVGVEVKTNLSFNDLVSELKRSDLFALPSLAEGFGHAILEAMACGLPVLTTRNTCAPDIMEDGTEGFLVPIRSPGSIAEKLDWGARNRGTWPRWGKRRGGGAATSRGPGSGRASPRPTRPPVGVWSATHMPDPIILIINALFFVACLGAWLHFCERTMASPLFLYLVFHFLNFVVRPFLIYVGRGDDCFFSWFIGLQPGVADHHYGLSSRPSLCSCLSREAYSERRSLAAALWRLGYLL